MFLFSYCAVRNEERALTFHDANQTRTKKAATETPLKSERIHCALAAHRRKVNATYREITRRCSRRQQLLHRRIRLWQRRVFIAFLPKISERAACEQSFRLPLPRASRSLGASHTIGHRPSRFDSPEKSAAAGEWGLHFTSFAFQFTSLRSRRHFWFLRGRIKIISVYPQWVLFGRMHCGSAAIAGAELRARHCLTTCLWLYVQLASSISTYLVLPILTPRHSSDEKCSSRSRGAQQKVLLLYHSRAPLITARFRSFSALWIRIKSTWRSCSAARSAWTTSFSRTGRAGPRRSRSGSRRTRSGWRSPTTEPDTHLSSG